MEGISGYLTNVPSIPPRPPTIETTVDTGWQKWFQFKRCRRRLVLGNDNSSKRPALPVSVSAARSHGGEVR